jgi:ectoine hydroxylase-related dioxygenase (phytanoyl-CoA dioxygenase family)
MAAQTACGTASLLVAGGNDPEREVGKVTTIVLTAGNESHLTQFRLSSRISSLSSFMCRVLLLMLFDSNHHVRFVPRKAPRIWGRLKVTLSLIILAFEAWRKNMPDPIELTEEQVRFFHRMGYLAIPRITDEEDVAFLLRPYDRIFAERAGREIGDQFDLAGTDEADRTAALPQILHPANYAPEMNRSRLLANATSVAKQLLGPEAICEIAHAIFKPARYGAETPWHQDAAYWDPELHYRAISIWVPLQEATEENGCMEFVPQSHLLDVLRHRSINDDPRIHGLELHPDEMFRIRGAVRCPLPGGGATFHGPYTLHHTGENRSQIPRRALILNATLPPSARATPLHFPWLEEKSTAREARVKAAREKGLDPGTPPTGARQ